MIPENDDCSHGYRDGERCDCKKDRPEGKAVTYGFDCRRNIHSFGPFHRQISGRCDALFLYRRSDLIDRCDEAVADADHGFYIDRRSRIVAQLGSQPVDRRIDSVGDINILGIGPQALGDLFSRDQNPSPADK